MIKREAERRLSTRFGNWQEILYRRGQREIVVLLLGEVREGEGVPCRIHSSCLSAHVLNSIECDCREQMEMAQSYIATQKCGIIIVLEQEGMGNGHQALMLAAKMASDESISQDRAY